MTVGKLWVIVVAGIVLMFAVVWGTRPQPEPPLRESETRAQVERKTDLVVMAQRHILGSLKDPDSAKFSLWAQAEVPGEYKMACGYVNARNGFGGYTGNQLYFYVDPFGDSAVYCSTESATDKCTEIIRNHRIGDACVAAIKAYYASGAPAS